MIANPATRNLVNFVLFQCAWLACVLYPGLGSGLFALAVVVFHLAVISQQRSMELQFIGLGIVLGGLMDSLWFRIGVLGLDSGEEIILAPPWLIAIWAVFMTTLCHSLNWISAKRWLPFVLAPVAGPFAYWSAGQLGVVNLPGLFTSLLGMAAGWLILFPLLLWLRRALYPELVS
ncbi:DUF2878 domain-containing protein [Marinobacter fuscus]|uniref:DUF2878 domain-containing protein n=1 Tax=Marinobacter fuscus TaxID=2109942 RepID=A0A2T1KQ50_9GAMM|nr:DUF2878 domain-containing protein [Marinobacter fuscus]PSF12234.1 DUF2878 domain-containing protein [Marinobacter fuscus]